MRKGIIFDLDGTLLDTITDLSESVNTALRAFGYPEHTEAAYKKMVGNGFRKLLLRAMPEALSEEEKARMEEPLYMAFTEEYSRRYLRATAPYPGIQSMLARLSDAGIPLGVNSNKRDDYTKALISNNFPDIPFVCVVGGREGVPHKPDPRSALEIAEKMGVKSPGGKEGSGLFGGLREKSRANALQKIAYVGDSAVDMETARNAGMLPVGCAWGFRGREELAAAGAAFIAEDALSLAEYLLEK